MIVRQAEIDEISALVEMGRAMHSEGDFASVPFDDGVFRSFLEIVLSNIDYVAFVAEREGRIVGAMLGLVSPFFFSTALRAGDILLYVVPESRGSSAALRLVNAFEAWAEMKGVCRTYLGASSNIGKAGEFYNKMGYDCVGGLYRKEGRKPSDRSRKDF